MLDENLVSKLRIVQSKLILEEKQKEDLVDVNSPLF